MGPITLPEIIDLSVTPLKLTPGTYMELVNDAWAGKDVDTDPTLKLTDKVGSLLATVGDKLPGGDEAISGLVTQGNNIPAQGSTTFKADMDAASATMQTRYQATVDAFNATPPLLELPLNPAGQTGIAGPPTETEIDIGNLSMSGSPYVYFVGNAEIAGTGTPIGVQNLLIYQEIGGIALIVEDDVENNEGVTIRQVYHLQIFAKALGPGIIQANYNNSSNMNLVILTFKFTGVV